MALDMTAYKDVADSLRSMKPFEFVEKGNPLLGTSDKVHTINRALTFGELLKFSVDNADDRHHIMNYGMVDIYRQIGSTDVLPLLAATFAPVMASLKNPDTVAFDILRSSREPVAIRDWQIRIPEERIGNLRAVKFNPDGSRPAQDQSVRTTKFNTLMFVGNQLQSTIVAGEMVAQQYDLQLMQREIMMEAIRIKQAANYYALRGTEQKSFAPSNIPECEGIHTDSPLTNIDCGGGNISEALINEALLGIAGYIGWNYQVIGLTNNPQMTTMRNLELARYGGATQATSKAYYDDFLSRNQRLRDTGLKMVRWFEPANGNPIPFFYEKDLPSGATLLFVYDLPGAEPCLAEFQMGGQAGPWALARPTADLVYLVVSFYGFSVVSPLQEIRSVLFNHL